ncbi:RAMP superfamily CRISPR-associated protein [Fusibacter sp. 3D3]|uniref:RAMP superfamily CRISPR-associated protein n=1 Tax=Fusibacter sp. 3D3 TaxID=1048380 RepID=UPI000853A5BF|nr:RAMP superfamily CRISPR-associated protein [Fusibacter sp. 3D3]GAU79971.1 DUF324 domain-containing protein [Fusibacter sp. 3D3]
MQYVMKIELLSETVIGSGVSVPGSVDNDIIYNEIGLPYIKGKTLKGNLRESFENVLQWLKYDQNQVYTLFGMEGVYNPEYGILNISDGNLSESVTHAIQIAINEETLYLQEVKYALTNERYFTEIEEGVAKSNSLRSVRTIEPGIEFFSKLQINRTLSELEECLLAASISIIKNIGLMRSRGKGSVECTLYKNDENITRRSIEILERRLGL